MATTNNIFPRVEYEVDFDGCQVPDSNTNLVNLIELSAWIPNLNSVNYLNNLKNGQTFTLYGEEALYFKRLVGQIQGMQNRSKDILGNRSVGAGPVDVNTLMPFKVASTNLDFCHIGVLNHNYGVQGIAEARSTLAGSGYNRSAVQQDGKVLCCGETAAGAALLTRWNADGTLDGTFGSGGHVVQVVNTSSSFNDLVVDRYGNIFCGGFTDDAGNIEHLVAKYDTDGVLDSSFGTAGLVIFGDANTDIVLGIDVQPDGKIICCGETDVPPRAGVIFRLDANGSLDASFGTAGVTIFDPNGIDEFCQDIKYQNGRIVVCGSTDVGAGVYEIFVAGFTGAGALDASFGTAGVTQTGIGGIDDRAEGMDLLSDGGIVVAGRTQVIAVDQPFITQYTSAGALVTTSIPGAVFTDAGWNDIAVGPDDRIIVVGAEDDGASTAAIISKYTHTPLAVDTSFGTAGVTYTYAANEANGVDILNHNYMIAVSGNYGSGPDGMSLEYCGIDGNP